MKLGVVAGALALALGIHLGKLALDAGALRKIHPHFDGQCRVIRGIAGPEDMEISTRTGLLFISSDHRPEHPGERTPDGAIYALDLTDPRAAPRVLTSGLGFEFHPHGISVRETELSTRIWVINHRREMDTIEVFDYAQGTLAHEMTLSDPLLINCNDLKAVGDDQFYVTHDHGSRSSFLNRLEDYSRLGRGYVTYFDGNHFTVKASGISFANGITLGDDPTRLLVASMLGRKILVYGRNPTTGDLKWLRSIPLGTSPDNLTLGPGGEIWVGAHPRIFDLKAQAMDHRRHAPAQVLRIVDPLSEDPRVEEVFLDDGTRISAASVAVNLGHRLLIGSVFADHILDCED